MKHVFGQVEFILCVWLLITHQIVSNVGENVGTIWKKWPGFNDEHNMDHEYFGLEGEWFQNIFWHAPICRPKHDLYDTFHKLFSFISLTDYC